MSSNNALIRKAQAFFLILSLKWRERVGFETIRQRPYKLMDATDGEEWVDVDFEQPFEEGCRPGRRYDQTMVFEEIGQGCPRCESAEEVGVNASKIRWYVDCANKHETKQRWTNQTGVAVTVH